MIKNCIRSKTLFDTRLSKDGTIACASCHDPKKAFCDNLITSIGINGQHTERNSPSILNAAFLPTVMFDAHLKTLELQVIVPLQEPTEMGHNMKELIPFYDNCLNIKRLRKKFTIETLMLMFLPAAYLLLREVCFR